MPGWGSNTAFTAGVLKRILKEKKRKFEIVGLSGYESKLNRNPTFIQDLMNYGEEQAGDFLK